MVIFQAFEGTFWGKTISMQPVRKRSSTTSTSSTSSTSRTSRTSTRRNQ